MKKFEFSLERVLDYKTHLEKNEKSTLREMRSNHSQLCTKLDDLIYRQNTYKKQYGDSCLKGTFIREVMMLRNYIEELQDQIERILSSIHKIETEIEIQINKVLGLSQENKSMGKLKDKHYLLYSKLQMKETEELIDEFVANSRFSDNRQIS